ncbi:class I SAM-dependent methyltransferase [Labrenzia sp. PHM005]|uniref:class I SAM-dependent methyltransferase n=1 Tax=Labrenzia sp. PHM005 TaxID=2590016 RepID=UPI001AD91409|nr:class I SAM-dependent methyltransferase [Labrenzia sp. PHM005]
MASIFETLEELGVASKATQEVFASRTRDRDNVTVYRDSSSGVIYIDGFYGGDEVYEDGAYRQANEALIGKRDYEVMTDAARRMAAYRPYVTGKHIVEFGCGDGSFLHAVQNEAQSCCGVELQDDYVTALNANGISCHTSLSALPDNSMDSALSFHVLEHLPEPKPILQELYRVLKPGGLLVAEVPHAKDVLLNELKSEAFKAFTLWSQHLVLHTRDSLSRLLASSGYGDIVIEGVQRYPLSNHLTWLSAGKPGGHKSTLAAIDTPDLQRSYEAALNRIDVTDTLVAIARKPA